jgi:electron transport complex protein RnfD
MPEAIKQIMPAKLLVTASPHIRSKSSTQRIMLDVIIALLPAVAISVFYFGTPALTLYVVTVAACVFTEWFSQKYIFKRPGTVKDLSAVVTGLLLAASLPVSVPIWMGALGGVIAIFFVKQLFGGLGQNFMNPALGARVFLFLAWTGPMTKYLAPGQALDAVAGPTPMAILKGKEAGGLALPDQLQMLLGNHAGCIGETSMIALVIGAVYLMIRRVIKPKVPFLFIGTVALLSWVFGDRSMLFHGNVLNYTVYGGLILGAFFMATDYATQPVTPLGQIIFGVSLGVLTTVIRLWTNYPEGVQFAIILMNCLVPLIDRHTIPRTFGGKKNA